MKRFFVVIFVATVAAMFGLDSFAAAKKVAVFVEGNVSKEQKTMVNNSVMSRLSGNKDYKVFERNNAFLSALEKEHDYQLSGVCSEAQIRKIGERMGVDYVIAVCAVLTDDDQCQMSARLIDLESGEVLKTCNASREFEDSSTITALANNVAYRLISKKSR
ncbi:MAG: hypothetical protein HDS64_06020 [Bacteroidales bacterium]|nr:hypothetical protein [Bacteroidales bacterium]MBD5364919.1 hypothetical protein [Bacteroides sp.]